MQQLHDRHEDFSMNLTVSGRDMPVMMNWRHHDPELQQWEQKGFHMKTGTFRDLRQGLTTILERRDAFDEVREEAKKLAAQRKRQKQPLVPSLDKARTLEVHPVKQPSKDERTKAFEAWQKENTDLGKAIMKGIVGSDAFDVEQA